MVVIYLLIRLIGQPMDSFWRGVAGMASKHPPTPTTNPRTTNQPPNQPPPFSRSTYSLLVVLKDVAQLGILPYRVVLDTAGRQRPGRLLPAPAIPGGAGAGRRAAGRLVGQGRGSEGGGGDLLVCGGCGVWCMVLCGWVGASVVGAGRAGHICACTRIASHGVPFESSHVDTHRPRNPTGTRTCSGSDEASGTVVSAAAAARR